MPAIGTGQTIRDFFSHKSLALVGFSRSGRKFSNNVHRELSGKGYRIFPINPAAGVVGGIKVYPSFKDLPEPVTAAVLMTPRAVTPEVVREAAEAGVTSIWIQQGAESKEAVQVCREKNLSFVSGRCILMFAEPAIWLHRVHRGFLRFFGRLPA
ncbi:MAG: CoA-binding protein [Acidobacteria bacterium]|nr:MAG: CoA-binding protein [Acidobacteriota bacterium]